MFTGNSRTRIRPQLQIIKPRCPSLSTSAGAGFLLRRNSAQDALYGRGLAGYAMTRPNRADAAGGACVRIFRQGVGFRRVWRELRRLARFACRVLLTVSAGACCWQGQFRSSSKVICYHANRLTLCG